MKDAHTWNELAAEIVRLNEERDALKAAMADVVRGGTYCKYCANSETCGAEIVRCKRFVWRSLETEPPS